MWILTGVVLGTILSSTHADEEACRGRKAMLEKIQGINQLECRPANDFSSTTSTSKVWSSPLTNRNGIQ